ncbi:MAG: WecB/TagA/CpsF family glycosyltransferase [Pirellulales bacterium]
MPASTIDAASAPPNAEKQLGTHGWPARLNVIGIGVTPTTYEDAVQTILHAAERRESGVVSCHAVHAVVTCGGDAKLRERVNRFDMITPDGQPVRWALNWLYGAGLSERVYGPELTMRLCRAAAQRGVSIYLYGGSPRVVERLSENLRQACPGLVIAGAESPPFRELTAEEDEAVVQRINDSGAGLVFIGLGCPKQDIFAAEHRDRIRSIQLCVGAAFDFHAGEKQTAPAWMQQRGLEWLFRLWQEPRRLWKRYLVTNTQFVTRLFAQRVRNAFAGPAENIGK